MKKIIITAISTFVIGYAGMKITAYYEMRGFKKCQKFIKDKGWTIIDSDGNTIFIIND